MQIGMVGLGKMGGNMVRRLLRGGHECVVTDLSQMDTLDQVTTRFSMADFEAGRVSR